MKKIEIILITIFTLGFLLMLLSIPGQSILMILGIVFLSMVYTFFGFALLNGIRFRNIFKNESYQSISRKRIFGSIAAGIALGITLNGILFTLMFWTGSFMMLMEGIIFLAIITVIGAIKYSKNKANFYLNLFKRTITVGVIGLFLLLLPTEKLVNLKHHNNPKYAKILLKTLQYPDNIEYQKALQQEHEKMDPTLNRDSE